MEREGGHGRIGAVADRSGGIAEFHGRAERVGGVLDQHRASALGQVFQPSQVGGVAAQVHRQHRPQPTALQALERVGESRRRHQAGIRVDVREHHLCADEARAIGRGQEGDRRGDDRLARLHLQRQHGQMQGRGAVGAGHGVARPDLFGEGPLERLDRRAGGQKVAAQRLGDGRYVVVLDGLAAVGQHQSVARRRRWSGAPSASRESSPSPDSHSSLVSLA